MLRASRHSDLSFRSSAWLATRYGRKRSARAAVSHPPGFTLFEMVIVLAVIALVAGMMWPSVSALLEHHNLKQAADLAGTRLGSGRVHALETGLTYQFRFEPGGRRFILVPFDPEPEQAEESSGVRAATRAAGMLPATCKFEGGGSFADRGTSIPDEWLSGLPDAADYSGALWSQPVLFHPNGTATDFEVLIFNQAKGSVRLNLRAITGGVTVSQATRG